MDNRLDVGPVAGPAIACDLQALGAERQAHQDQTAALFGAAQELRELSNGYGFRFATEDYQRIVTFVARERQCCPFFTFELHLPPAPAPLWLTISGPRGSKEQLRQLFELREVA